MITQSNNIQNKSDLNWGRFNSVFLIEVVRGGIVYTSTAVAIDKRTILTAAHSIDAAESVTLCLGHEYTVDSERIEANYWIINPGYNPSKSFYENDIAVVYLTEDLPVFTHYETISKNQNIDENSVLERVGYGGRDGRNIKTWTNPKYLSTGFNLKNFMFKDCLSVIGDSGGPIFETTDSGHKLIGIHSTLEDNDRTYIVNLSSHHDWIFNLEMKEVAHY